MDSHSAADIVLSSVTARWHFPISQYVFIVPLPCNIQSNQTQIVSLLLNDLLRPLIVQNNCMPKHNMQNTKKAMFPIKIWLPRKILKILAIIILLVIKHIRTATQEQRVRDERQDQQIWGTMTSELWTTMSRTNLPENVVYVTVFSWMLSTACFLVVGSGLGNLGLVFYGCWLVVLYTYLYHLPLLLYCTRRKRYTLSSKVR